MLDVLIIGGGVCGCSLLYGLSRYGVQAALVEATNDVGVATTKANSAILHAGYDPEPGTKMAKYNLRGNQLAMQLCQRLDILVRQTGSLVVGFDEADSHTLQDLYQRGLQNGVPDLQLLPKAALLALEPGLSENAILGLYTPTAAVVNPWELAFAQAEVAVRNGAQVHLDHPVTAIEKTAESFTVTAGGRAFAARFVVNAAGVHAGDVARMAGDSSVTIHPSRGQYYLLDKSQGEVVSHVVFQCPTPQGKGVLVAPTVHGNLIVGPSAEPAGDVATTREGLDFVRGQAMRAVPGVDLSQSIRNFSGLRAVADTGDFIVGESEQVPGFFQMAGIKSPGLTAAPAIAEDMVQMLGAAGLPLKEKADFDDTRAVFRFSHATQAQQAAAIAQNPLYGQIVCRCATVTEGEVVDALRRPLPPRSLDAVKRRVGPGMGRCQSGFCGPRVQAIIARELGIPQQDVPQDRTGMNIIVGRTKDAAFAAPIATEVPHE